MIAGQAAWRPTRSARPAGVIEAVFLQHLAPRARVNVGAPRGFLGGEHLVAHIARGRLQVLERAAAARRDSAFHGAGFEDCEPVPRKASSDVAPVTAPDKLRP